MNKKMLVLFTMDVEPAALNAGTSGPSSDEAGLNAIHDYQATLGAYGYNATYFVHPELTRDHPAFFQSLAKEGATLGLHVHTTKFTADKQECELGGLTADKQKKILQLASEMFEKGVGVRPTLFRPGCFSANDATYGVLAELGFTGGSISIPGRIWPDRYCVWSGAYPYAHFGHESFRQREGTVPFVDIPLSVDMTGQPRWNPVGFYHYPDLRPGGVYSQTDEVSYDRRELLHNIIGQMAEDNPPMKTLVVDVHNDRDFKSENSEAGRHLRAVLEGIEPECRAVGLKACPSTYAEAVEYFNKTIMADDQQAAQKG